MAPENVFAPAKVWAPVVTNPLALAPASGILNVWAVPLLAIPKSVPLLATAKVWDSTVNPFRVLGPP